MNPNEFNNMNGFNTNNTGISNNEPKINLPTNMQKMNDPFFQDQRPINTDNTNDNTSSYNTNYNISEKKNTQKNNIMYKYLIFLIVLIIVGVIIYFASTFVK